MAIISKNIEHLKPNKEYIVTVRAKNNDINALSGYTDSIRFQTPTDSTVPNAPTGLALAASFLNVLFVYTDSTDNDLAKYEYELYKQDQIQIVQSIYQVISGQTPHRTGYVQTNVFTVSVDDNSTTTSTTSVTNLVKYYGRVRSIDSAGNISGWTNIVASGNTPLIDEQFIGSLTAAKITAGTIGAHTITLSGVNSIIKSSNFDGIAVGDGSYSGANTGWLINGQGKAYFYDATVVGSIDIGGFDAGSFHVNTYGDMWLGAGTFGAAPFRVSNEGVLEIGAGTGSRIGGQLIDAIAETVIDFNGRNNRNSTPVTAPTLPSPVTVGNLVIGASYTISSPGNTNFISIGATNNNAGTVFIATQVGTGTGTVLGETIDHTLNTDGSANISFEWNYTYSSADNAANNIDGFYVHLYSSTSSDPYTFGTTPNLEATYPVDYLQRALIFSGLPADKYYTFGVKAFRVVDKDIAAPGIIYSSMVKSSVTGENPYRPSANVNYTGDIGGTLASTIVSYANAGNTVAINFNADNDSNGLTPTSPVIVSNGTAIDHVINTDGSADISLEWTYTTSDTSSAANNIDGFIIYVRSSTSASAYTIGTTPADETTYYLPREKRALILPGVAANRYYTLGVRAYRMVNSNVATPGIVYSPIVQSSVTGENPYQPSTTVAFAGNVTGTIDNVDVATLVSYANAGNTVATNFNTDNDSNGLTPTSPVIVSNGTAIDHTENTDGSVDISFEWTYTHSDTYNVANNIDGFIVYVRSTDIAGATPSSSYVFGSDPSKETTYYLPREKRAFITPGVPADRNYNFAVRAYRMVNSNVATPGIVYSPIIQSTYANELYYQPSTTVAFGGNVTGTIDNIPVATLIDYANAGNTVAINFNTDNDSNGLTPTSPVIVSNGTAIDHTENTDGSVDISFEWTYTHSDTYNVANNIDGFIVYVRSTDIAGATPSSSYVFGSDPSKETTYYLPREKRAFITPGVPADRNYNFAVRAYRMVNSNVATPGIVYSPIIQSTYANELYYQPSTTVAFGGNITGTIDGLAATIIKDGTNNFNNNNDRFDTIPASATGVTFLSPNANFDGSINLTMDWVYPGSTFTAGYFVAGAKYNILTLGTTTQAEWNTIAGTSGISYIIGSTFTASSGAQVGTGTAIKHANSIDGFAIYLRAKDTILVTAITTSTVYKIVSLGNTTSAQWNTVGVSGTAAVGTIFTASSGARVGDGRVIKNAQSDITVDDFNVSGITVFYLTPEKSAITFPPLASDKLYRAAIRAYRMVDTDINSTGIIYGSLVNTAADYHKGLPIIGGDTGITIGNGKIFIGVGNYANADTGFYVDATPNFSLGDKLTWNGNTLTVTGAINATSGTFNGRLQAGDIYIPNTTSPVFSVTTAGALTASSVTITGGTVGPIITNPTKFFIGAGHYGNADTGFYVDATPNFSLGDKLTWNGNTLTVTGAINATSGTFNGRLQAGDIYIPNTTSPVFSVTTAGALTASSVTITGGTISIGSGNNIFKADSNGIYLGDATFAIAKFSVTPAGFLKSTSGSIAGWTIGTDALHVGLNGTSGTSYINTLGGAWFSAGVLAPSFSGFGAPSTTGGATSTITTPIAGGFTRGYLRNISYGTNAQKPTSPVLGDIHFT